MLAVAGMLAIVAAPTSTAHPESHGTLTFYNELGREPTTELECEFWVEGDNITHQEGMLRWLHQVSGPSTHAEDLAPWNGTPDGSGNFTFLIGPIEAPTMDSFVGAERAPARVYGNMEGDSEHQTRAEAVTYLPCDEDEPAEPVPSECPPVELDGFARSDGSIYVNASGLHATDFDGELALMRSDGGEFEQVAPLEVGDQSYIDTDTEIGTTYMYELVLDGKMCSALEVTAIPVFPTILAGGAAIGVSILGYAAIRRRR